MSRCEVAQELRSRRHWHACISGEQIFQQERHAGERAFRERAVSGFARFVEHRRDDRIDRRVDALDAFDRGFDQFDRLDLFATHQLGLSRCIESGKFICLRLRHDD
jgi:hypothetical protein